MIRAKQSGSGLTLVEVLITVVLVASLGITIIAGTTYGIFAQQSIHEQNGAMRLAAGILDEQKRRLFETLQPIHYTEAEARALGMIIYDNASPNNRADDVAGAISLQFFDREGEAVGTEDKPIPRDLSSVHAEVIVRWRSAGKRVRTVTLNTILSP